jgi:hypothetical protein
MLRVVSLVGLAVLTIAAVAAATNPRQTSEEPAREENGRTGEARERLQLARPEIAYHARFSLN